MARAVGGKVELSWTCSAKTGMVALHVTSQCEVIFIYVTDNHVAATLLTAVSAKH